MHQVMLLEGSCYYLTLYPVRSNIHVLIPAPWLESFPQLLKDRALAVQAARIMNDELAAVIASAPDRFRGVAILPTLDPDAAVAELHRAVKELRFVGAFLALGPVPSHVKPNAGSHLDPSCLLRSCQGSRTPILTVLSACADRTATDSPAGTRTDAANAPRKVLLIVRRPSRGLRQSLFIDALALVETPEHNNVVTVSVGMTARGIMLPPSMSALCL
jgi:hypothetical protein